MTQHDWDLEKSLVLCVSELRLVGRVLEASSVFVPEPDEDQPCYPSSLVDMTKTSSCADEID